MSRVGKIKLLLIFVVLSLILGISGWKKNENRIYQVACIGDSITYGAGVVNTRDTDSYPAQLSQLLGERYEVYNYGVSGRTLLTDTNKPYRETGYIEAVIAQQPDIIVIMLGSNDSKQQNWAPEEYREQYIALVEELQDISGEPQIYLAQPPEAFAGEDGTVAYGIDNVVIRDEISVIIQEVASYTGAKVINLYEATEDCPEYFMDGVHPNKEGNAVIAQCVYESIRDVWWK